MKNQKDGTTTNARLAIQNLQPARRESTAKLAMKREFKRCTNCHKNVGPKSQRANPRNKIVPSLLRSEYGAKHNEKEHDVMFAVHTDYSRC